MRSKIALALFALTLSVSPLLADDNHKSCDMHKGDKAACCMKEGKCDKDKAKDHEACKNDKDHAACKKACEKEKTTKS